jgi:sulfopyruvate decarboxylase TPP-binding subunit
VPTDLPMWAAGVCAGLHAAGSRHVVYVPDNPLSHVLRGLREQYADVVTTIATREEEAFGIAAGLYLGGHRPTVMLQSSGPGQFAECADVAAGAVSDSRADRDQHARRCE